MVTIGDNPLCSLSPLVCSLPLCHHSHMVHPPHTHHNLVFPLRILQKRQNTTSHLCRGVQFRLSLMVTLPQNSIFILPAMELFSASVSASPGLSNPLLAAMPWCKKMALGAGSGDLRTENGIAIKAAVLEEQ